jgi:hypothetical protein
MCWCIDNLRLESSFFFSAFVMSFGSLSVISIACSVLWTWRSIALAVLFLLESLLVLLSQCRPDKLLFCRPLRVGTSIVVSCLCCLRLFRFSFFFWVMFNFSTFNYLSSVIYRSYFLGVLIFLLCLFAVRPLHSSVGTAILFAHLISPNTNTDLFLCVSPVNLRWRWVPWAPFWFCHLEVLLTLVMVALPS